MSSFDNTMNISSIDLLHHIKCYCTIGKTLCTYVIEATLIPDTTIPDYLEVQSSLDELNNHWYTMEAACAEVHDRIAMCCGNSYKKLQVSISCCDARHFPVKVTKEVVRDDYVA